MYESQPLALEKAVFYLSEALTTIQELLIEKDINKALTKTGEAIIYIKNINYFFIEK